MLAVASLCWCLTGCGGGDSDDSATSTVDDANLDVEVDLGELEVDPGELEVEPGELEVDPGDLEVEPGDATTTDGEPAAGDSSSAVEGWGDLTMRFVYDGDPPAPQQVNITSDVEFCSKHPPMDESLVVNPDDKGIANVVVFLYVGRDDPLPTPHSSYEETANDVVELDNQSCRFQPHIRTVRTSQTLRINNKDEVGHNTKADLSQGAFNDTIAKGESIDKQLSTAERIPVRVSCNIHPWMKGFLVVKDHPYVAVSDANGRIHMRNIPSGPWTFQVWHEAAGYVSTVMIDGQSTEWRRGRFDRDIQVGENDLGEVVVAPSLFEETS
jgi:plastocyanin